MSFSCCQQKRQSISITLFPAFSQILFQFVQDGRTKLIVRHFVHEMIECLCHDALQWLFLLWDVFQTLHDLRQLFIWRLWERWLDSSGILEKCNPKEELTTCIFCSSLKAGSETNLNHLRPAYDSHSQEISRENHQISLSLFNFLLIQGWINPITKSINQSLIFTHLCDTIRPYDGHIHQQLAEQHIAKLLK